MINFKKTKALFPKCAPTSLVVLEEVIVLVEDFYYVGSVI